MSIESANGGRVCRRCDRYLKKVLENGKDEWRCVNPQCLIANDPCDYDDVDTDDGGAGE